METEVTSVAIIILTNVMLSGKTLHMVKLVISELYT